MEVEWNDEKSDACLRLRGFNFAYAALVFHDPRRTVIADERFDYDEGRFIVYGHIAGRLFVVVFTERGGVCRIISARKANKREVKRYGHYQN
jgi:uncharacterized DUF497 family protein